MNESNDCVFCKIIRGELPCKKVFEDEHTLAFLSNGAVTPGHTLIVPKEHYRNFCSCPPEVLNQIVKTTQKIAAKYPSCKIVVNNEKPLQEVFHLHFHVIPCNTDTDAETLHAIRKF